MMPMSPVLLLLPGLLNTPRVFDRLRQHFDDAVELRIADLRTQPTIAAMADDAWAMLADLPPERPLVIAGYSMGGYVALQMMHSAPRAVQGLGLVCTSARADTQEGTALRERAIASIERDFDRFVGGLVGFLLSAQGQHDETLRAEVRADMQAVGAATAVRQHRAAALRADQRQHLPGLALPVQVVGATADPVTPLALSEELAQMIPGARLDLIEGAGHLVPFEHPARLAALLRGLTDRP